jgi:cytochrome c oxidase assembly protein subunit 17
MEKIRQEASQTGDKPAEKPLKACCACKPTRKMRDDCIMNFSQEQCTEYINAHNECLKEKGFKVVQSITGNP